MKYWKFILAFFVSMGIAFYVKSNEYKFPVGQTFCVLNVTEKGEAHKFTAKVLYRLKLNHFDTYIVGPDIGINIPPVNMLAIVDNTVIDYWLQACSN
jgi:hypothetical protein